MVQKVLHEQGIPTAVHYPVGLHEQPILKDMYPEMKNKYPHTEYAATHVLSLPMHPYLELHDQKRIANVLESIEQDILITACVD